jgi:hypothetical protein
VGAGFDLAGEAEACWLGAVPALETRARIMSKTIRMTGCIRIQQRGERGAAPSA